jgi:uncharacterized protein
MDERIYTSPILFTWNEVKRLRNLRVHGFDFQDVHRVFAGPTLTSDDERFICYEQRFVTLGLLDGVPVAIAYTETEEVIHVISFRKATRHETALFFSSLPN